MATNTSLRFRRSEAQRHALAGVERDINLADPASRRKYLRDFNEAYQSYESVLTLEERKILTASADILLVGDYHALPSSQRFGATLLEERSQPGDRPVVLGVETIFSRDQHILDEWWRREIDEAELRKRIRFDLDWGYDWDPFYALLVTAREHADAIYALDCMPREDLRKIGMRDRHAISKIAEMRERHPHAVLLILFGESHMAPGHLPRLIRKQIPEQKILTILQNVDALYWRAAGEQHERVEAVQVTQDTICVFNSTPLEKYESYRLHLSRWGRSEEDGPDLAPTIYNLIESLLRFLGINGYAARGRTQPKFIVDLLPEVFSNLAEPELKRLLAHETLSEEEQERLFTRIDERGSVYLPRINAFYVREFQMMYAAEEAARFLHNACRNVSHNSQHRNKTEDQFFVRVLGSALGYLGSRILHPARPSARDGVALSLDAYKNWIESSKSDANSFEDCTQSVGYALGSNLYNAYLEGSVTRLHLRRLFQASLGRSTAKKICAQWMGNHRSRRKGPDFDHRAFPVARSRADEQTLLPIALHSKP